MKDIMVTEEQPCHSSEEKPLSLDIASSVSFKKLVFTKWKERKLNVKRLDVCRWWKKGGRNASHSEKSSNEDEEKTIV